MATYNFNDKGGRIGNMEQVKSLVVAGLSGGSGKSVVTVGLVAALKHRGKGVAPFKKGPDYIDAGWMSRAAQRPCYNLDPYLMQPGTLVSTFQTHLDNVSFAVVEGNRGLFDGVNAMGEFSTAELALLLDLPVLLVVNCSKVTRTAAAMVLGCQALDPRVNFAGVILNQIANSRHETIIRQALAQATDLPVLGVMPRLKKDIFPMRHLGVTPHQETSEADEVVERLGALVETRFDLDALIPRMRAISPLPSVGATVPEGEEVTIGVLRDAAFQFYYEENLEALRLGGARLVTVDALHTAELPPELDGLYIGGGFPETSARLLSDNESFRHSVRERAGQGLPIYAECGGLIFLGRSLVIDDCEYPLADVFPVTFGLSAKPQAHGYSALVVERANSFYPLGTHIRGHEFRYSVVRRWDGEPEDLVFSVERGTGLSDGRDGLVTHNVLALYTHVMASGTPQWAPGFLAAARNYAKRQGRAGIPARADAAGAG